MDFRKYPPAGSVLSPEGDELIFTDREGNKRYGYFTKVKKSVSTSTYLNITGQEYERLLSDTGDGSLDAGKFLAQARRAKHFMEQHANAEKISLIVEFKSANYRHMVEKARTTTSWKATVRAGQDVKTFTGINREDVMKEAIEFMKDSDNATLAIEKVTKDKPDTIRTTLLTYAGVSNLSHVEIEATVAYLTESPGWIIFPVGVGV